MNRRKPCFFKFLLPNLSDKRLEIPKAFLKHLDGEYSDTAYLRGPTGTIWKVRLGEDRRGYLFLISGWKKFVEDNSIQAGYCLVFRYHGSLRFTVKIFGTTLCMVVHGLDPSSPYPVDSGDGSETIKRSGKFLSGVHNASVKNDASEFGRCEHLVESSSDSESIELNKPLSPKRTSSTTQLSVKRKAGRHDWYEFISQRRPVTKVEIQRVYDAAKSFRSENPFGLVVMRQSYVYYGFLLLLPATLTKSSLPKASVPMTLYDQSGRSWETRYIYNKDNYGGRGYICNNWMTFASTNNLEDHDACVFELIGRNEMQVHIFRVVEKIAPLLKNSLKQPKKE